MTQIPIEEHKSVNVKFYEENIPSKVVEHYKNA